MLIPGLGLDHAIENDGEIRDRLDTHGKSIIKPLISAGMDDDTISTLLAQSFTRAFRYNDDDSPRLFDAGNIGDIFGDALHKVCH
jgi:hypothetical protein